MPPIPGVLQIQFQKQMAAKPRKRQAAVSHLLIRDRRDVRPRLVDQRRSLGHGLCFSCPGVFFPPIGRLFGGATLFEVGSRMLCNLPLKTPSPGKVLIFYRRIAHVTPKKLKSCVFKW